jgi:hypothetical protein
VQAQVLGTVARGMGSGRLCAVIGRRGRGFFLGRHAPGSPLSVFCTQTLISDFWSIFIIEKSFSTKPPVYFGISVVTAGYRRYRQHLCICGQRTAIGGAPVHLQFVTSRLKAP